MERKGWKLWMNKGLSTRTWYYLVSTNRFGFWSEKTANYGFLYVLFYCTDLTLAGRLAEQLCLRLME